MRWPHSSFAVLGLGRSLERQLSQVTCCGGRYNFDGGENKPNMGDGLCIFEGGDWVDSAMKVLLDIGIVGFLGEANCVCASASISVVSVLISCVPDL